MKSCTLIRSFWAAIFAIFALFGTSGLVASSASAGEPMRLTAPEMDRVTAGGYHAFATIGQPRIVSLNVSSGQGWTRADAGPTSASASEGLVGSTDGTYTPGDHQSGATGEGSVPASASAWGGFSWNLKGSSTLKPESVATASADGAGTSASSMTSLNCFGGCDVSTAGSGAVGVSMR